MTPRARYDEGVDDLPGASDFGAGDAVLPSLDPVDDFSPDDSDFAVLPAPVPVFFA